MAVITDISSKNNGTSNSSTNGTNGVSPTTNGTNGVSSITNGTNGITTAFGGLRKKISMVINPAETPAKKEDISRKHPFPIHIDFSNFSFALLLIKFLVLVFDIITYPFYAIYQQPWKHRAASRRVRARLQDPNDPYSTYVRVDKPFTNHYAFKPETIPEFQQLSLKLNPHSQHQLGTREIISVTSDVQKNGKRLIKYNLGDYSWITIGQCDEIIGKLAKSFLHNGVKFQERVLIFSETRMGMIKLK